MTNMKQWISKGSMMPTHWEQREKKIAKRAGLSMRRSGDSVFVIRDVLDKRSKKAIEQKREEKKTMRHWNG